MELQLFIELPFAHVCAYVYRNRELDKDILHSNGIAWYPLRCYECYHTLDFRTQSWRNKNASKQQLNYNYNCAVVIPQHIFAIKRRLFRFRFSIFYMDVFFRGMCTHTVHKRIWRQWKKTRIFFSLRFYTFVIMFLCVISCIFFSIFCHCVLMPL